MILNDVKKAQELVSALSEGIAMQQEILARLCDSIIEYQEFLKKQIKENQNEIRITDHE